MTHTHQSPALAVSRRFRPGLQKTTWQSAAHPHPGYGTDDLTLEGGAHALISAGIVLARPRDSRKQSESWGIRGVTCIRSDRDQTRRRCRDGPSEHGSGRVSVRWPDWDWDPSRSPDRGHHTVVHVQTLGGTGSPVEKTPAPAVRALEDWKAVSIFRRSGGGTKIVTLSTATDGPAARDLKVQTRV